MNLLPRCPLVKYVVFFSNGVIQKHTKIPISDLSRLNETARKSVEAARKAAPEGVQLFDILELEERGRETIEKEARERGDGQGPLYMHWKPPVEERPTAKDLAVIMYTSGSTGECTSFVNATSAVPRPLFMLEKRARVLALVFIFARATGQWLIATFYPFIGPTFSHIGAVLTLAP